MVAAIVIRAMTRMFASEARRVGVARDVAPGPATRPVAAAVLLSSRSSPGLGSLLNDRYELGQVIGRGGMSTVHRAHDRRTGRQVAVKVSRSVAAAIDADGRARHEMDVLSALDDPGLIAVLDADGGDGSTPAYLVTELVAGPTLAEWIRHTTLTEVQAARLGVAMCRTLAYVHAQGIVHCDVKPANILLPGRDEADLAAPKLADFGIAAAVDSTPFVNGDLTVGTPNYLSPEQVRGHPISPATDVYSLGLVLIEALTGTLAYPGDGVEAATARLTRSATLPSHASDGLRAVLADMTALDPLDRPAAGRAAKLLDDVAGGDSLADEILLLGRPGAEPPEPRPAVAVRTPRRRIGVVAVAAGSMIAGCAVVIATLVSAGSPPRAPAPRAAPPAALPTAPAPQAATTPAAPPNASPALRRTPAPPPAPARLAAAAGPRGEQPGTGHLTRSPRHHHHTAHPGQGRAGPGKAGRHGKASRHGKSGHGKSGRMAERGRGKDH